MNGQDVPVRVHCSDGNLISYWHNTTDGLIETTNYVTNLFNIDVSEVRVFKDAINMIERMSRRQKKPLESVTALRIIASEEELIYILRDCKTSSQIEIRSYAPPNFRFSEKFRKIDFLYILYGQWLTLDNLFTMDGIDIVLGYSNLSDSDLNVFLKHWLAGGCPRLKYLDAGIHSVNILQVLAGLLDNAVFVQKSRNYTSPFGYTSILSDGYDIQRSDVPPAACLPYQNNTVLYAYSTNIDYGTYDGGVEQMINFAYMYATMANVRFDTKQEEEIEYHSDKKSLQDSLDSHKPDPSLGYGDKTTGSNLYNILKKFLNNGNVSICGAQVYIAVKRYPDESDVSDIISQLRANHVMVFIAVDSIPSGGSNSATLYEMSYETNGYCYFATGYDLSEAFDWMTAILDRPYQFIAQNFVVSGSGRIEIPTFKTPIPMGINDAVRFAITVQNHTLDNSFVSMNYTIESTDGSDVYKFPSNNAHPLYGTAQSGYFYSNGPFSFKWTIDYQYNNDAPQIIECRMYSYYYHDFLPLPDFK
ncbi:hypothetical protein GCK72_015588 [Caenorhabditis remanei]|uniref:Uncharacterized protein n=1 Tax=Caenorhabditis remanei TaxID=31234 RepID=A0A6A5GVE5_CAERE|nr:hypothetical protein GCK72_015588 [Caenorhabditis remanei]KAF1759127.1 hypothetical protein GCK72_015588 [Caenorhabditis remanei]